MVAYADDVNELGHAINIIMESRGTEIDENEESGL
jgi:hypothetical protein